MLIYIDKIIMMHELCDKILLQQPKKLTSFVSERIQKFELRMKGSE